MSTRGVGNEYVRYKTLDDENVSLTYQGFQIIQCLLQDMLYQ